MNQKISASRLSGKTVVITGGAGLIGRGFSRACAEEGAALAILEIDQAAGQKLAESLIKDTNNRKIISVKCDITDEKSVKAALKKVQQHFKRIDVLVNNAYPRNKNYGRKFEQATHKDFCENIDAHLGGYFLVTREVVVIMKKQKTGNIINMGSIYGFSAPKFDIYKGTNMTSTVGYSVIKGGVINFTRYLATYLGDYNIRANSLSPGGVFNNQPKKFIKQYSQRVHLGKRMAKVEDLIGPFLFLASDDSRHVTGQNLVVDGGWSL